MGGGCLLYYGKSLFIICSKLSRSWVSRAAPDHHANIMFDCWWDVLDWSHAYLVIYQCYNSHSKLTLCCRVVFFSFFGTAVCISFRCWQTYIKNSRRAVIVVAFNSWVWGFKIFFPLPVVSQKASKSDCCMEVWTWEWWKLTFLLIPPDPFLLKNLCSRLDGLMRVGSLPCCCLPGPGVDLSLLQLILASAERSSTWTYSGG